MPADPRTYITVHDGMPEHPKIEGLSDGAFRLLVTCWCWCSRNLTDGQIKAASWEKRGTPELRLELTLAGLVEPTPDGVHMHDYLEHQRSAEEVADLREKRAEAGRKGGLAKANAVASAKASATAFAKQKLKQNASKVVAESETETEVTPSGVTGVPRKRSTRLDPAFIPSESSRQTVIADSPHLNLVREHARFVDHFTAASGARGIRSDWDATWRNWMRRAADDLGRGRQSTRQQETDGLFARAAARLGVTDQPAIDGRVL